MVEAGDGEQALRLVEGDEAQVLDMVLTSLLLLVVSAPELIAVLLECRPELPLWPCRHWANCLPTYPRCPFCGSRSTMRNWCVRLPSWFAARKRCAPAGAWICCRLALIGRTTTDDRKRPDGQLREFHVRFDAAPPSHGAGAPSITPRTWVGVGDAAGQSYHPRKKPSVFPTDVASHRRWIFLGTRTPLAVIPELEVALVRAQHLPRRGEPERPGGLSGFIASGFRCSLACFARSIATV